MLDDDDSAIPENVQVPSPGPDPPSVEGSDADDQPALDDAATDSEAASLFWRLVLVFDVALFCLAVGPMLVYFEGDWTTGLQVFALGVVSFGYGYYRLKTRETGTDD